MAEDNSWVFDSLVCFLHSPIWSAPLQTFIEDKSLIFDPNDESNLNEINVEHKIIHDEYKNLVDFMLGSFMEEMQITPEQFEVACMEGAHTVNGIGGADRSGGGGGGDNGAFSFHQGLFQQIWAANDIRIFIRMMTQRNVELQLQALDLIERRQISDVFDNEPIGELETDDHKPDGDDAQENDGIESTKQFLTSETASPTTDGATVDDTTDKFARLNLFFEKEKINSDELKSRQDYLRAQRDKILAIKKNARAQQLSETAKSSERPSSAKAAQKILAGTMDATAAVPPPESLQLRKMLARRLREEVVDID